MFEETEVNDSEYEERVRGMFHRDCPECDGRGYDEDNNPCYWCLGDGIVDADEQPLR